MSSSLQNNITNLQTILQIVQELPEGVELNFEVVGGTSQPSNPKENTIWVNTSTTITSWVFSAIQPASPVAGMVWIDIGESSDIAFNALKTNTIQIYPISAKQYIGSTWTDVTAKSYQNGAWVQWITELYLFNNGDKCTAVTGGWTTKKDTSISVNVGSSAITFSYSSGSGRSAAAYTTNKIDISKYTKMVVTGNMTAPDASEEGKGFVFGLTSSRSENPPTDWVCAKVHDSKGTFELTLDISNANGSYYACVYAHGSKVVVYTVSLK